MQVEGRAFLFADHRTESEIRLSVTLVRFEAAYHGIFKCNLRRLSDYANLRAFCRRMFDGPGIAETVNLDHIKRGDYSVESLNPTKIVPAGPDLSEIF
ncbi:glutathionyl-hydroquinone reductase [Rhizobium etli]|uniref:Glutathionyl-hydroquinone reductase n=1 Tax=Rhizobium etli TaxID=29449 RepID=A0A7W6ZFR8_RHIET|nr:glutathionyl-hydroquinone reductase [Rhizobium etli]MBB4535116.1 glutathionyl-hydroquinone reductase [Rhizobium etli]